MMHAFLIDIFVLLVLRTKVFAFFLWKKWYYGHLLWRKAFHTNAFWIGGVSFFKRKRLWMGKCLSSTRKSKQYLCKYSWIKEMKRRKTKHFSTKNEKQAEKKTSFIHPVGFAFKDEIISIVRNENKSQCKYAFKNENVVKTD